MRLQSSHCSSVNAQHRGLSVCRPLKEKEVGGYGCYQEFEKRVCSASIYREENASHFIQFFKNIGHEISAKEIQKFLLSQSEYLALRTIFRAHICWGDVVATQFITPSEDRFSDAFQFVEASCCTTFVSEEKKLVRENGYGRKLNPGIELLHVDNFLKFIE